MQVGYNTSILLLNDKLGEIEEDPAFGKKLSDACRERLPYRMPGGLLVIETHHADYASLIQVGGNTASVLAGTVGYQRTDEVVKLCLLREMAAALGYEVRRKPKPNRR